MYDKQCYALAESFLSQYANGEEAPQAEIDKYAPRLAQCIQTAIEDELSEIDAYNVMKDRRAGEALD